LLLDIHQQQERGREPNLTVPMLFIVFGGRGATDHHQNWTKNNPALKQDIEKVFNWLILIN